ncbi:uncharacterized protein A4U43_C04F21390 [Asparagus officinalis]|uniref:Uncharacterized protein n=1 Tax=Asparagus officinalis TaxID=4686 RepID=A0A5P1F7C9_ASPOF|nr:uncharacterized protein A4U43_C04F21390 [Asparagus officinalis]
MEKCFEIEGAGKLRVPLVELLFGRRRRGGVLVAVLYDLRQDRALHVSEDRIVTVIDLVAEDHRQPGRRLLHLEELRSLVMAAFRGKAPAMRKPFDLTRAWNPGRSEESTGKGRELGGYFLGERKNWGYFIEVTVASGILD